MWFSTLYCANSCGESCDERDYKIGYFVDWAINFKMLLLFYSSRVSGSIILLFDARQCYHNFVF